MVMKIEMAKLKHVAKAKKFEEFWPDKDTHRWPWRELFWAWCHPILTVMIFCGVLAELTILFLIHVWRNL